MEILGRAGKKTSKLYGNCYNIRNLDTGELTWINLQDY